MGPVTKALRWAIELADSVLGGTGGLKAQMQNMDCNKTQMHAHHTHTTNRANHISERHLRFSTNRKHTGTDTEARQTNSTVCRPPWVWVMPKTAAKHTQHACFLQIKHVGHADHRPQRALHDYIRQVPAFVPAMPVQREVDGT